MRSAGKSPRHTRSPSSPDSTTVRSPARPKIRATTKSVPGVRLAGFGCFRRMTALEQQTRPDTLYGRGLEFCGQIWEQFARPSHRRISRRMHGRNHRKLPLFVVGTHYGPVVKPGVAGTPLVPRYPHSRLPRAFDRKTLHRRQLASSGASLSRLQHGRLWVV